MVSFEIIEGFRRWAAFKQLNKKYPGEGWDKIPAKIIDRKELDDYLKRRKADFDGPTTSIDIDEIGLPSQNSDGVDREKGIEDLAESPEDVLSYVMFPAPAKEFMEWRREGGGPERELVAAVVAALTEKNIGHKGISCFIVEKSYNVTGLYSLKEVNTKNFKNC